MVCPSRALMALLGASAVAATNTNININTDGAANKFLLPLTQAPHQTQTPVVTKSHTLNTPGTDHVLRDAPAVTDIQTSTQTSSVPDAATIGVTKFVHHHHCVSGCTGFCKKNATEMAKTNADRRAKGCSECSCSKNGAGSVSVTGSLKTAGVAVVGVVVVMAFL